MYLWVTNESRVYTRQRGHFKELIWAIWTLIHLDKSFKTITTEARNTIMKKSRWAQQEKLSRKRLRIRNATECWKFVRIFAGLNLRPFCHTLLWNCINLVCTYIHTKIVRLLDSHFCPTFQRLSCAFGLVYFKENFWPISNEKPNVFSLFETQRGFLSSRTGKNSLTEAITCFIWVTVK